MPDTDRNDIDTPDVPEGEAHLSSQFPDRLAVTGVLIKLIRQLFSADRANLMHPLVQQFFWQEGETTDPEKAPYQIVIDDVFHYDQTAIGRRPAIYVTADAWNAVPVSLGGNVFNTEDEDYQYNIQGAHTISIIGSNGASAELLAREVFHYCKCFAPKIRDALCFLSFDLPAIGPASELEEAQEYVVVQLPVQYLCNYSWTISPQQSRLLRQIVHNAIMKGTT